jgi:hypothetical protein
MNTSASNFVQLEFRILVFDYSHTLWGRLPALTLTMHHPKPPVEVSEKKKFFFFLSLAISYMADTT